MSRRAALDRLLNALRLPDPTARCEAVVGIGRYRFETGRPSARQRADLLDALLAMLVNDPDESVRYEIAYTLKFLPTPHADARVADALLDLLGDVSATPRLRGQAAESLPSFLCFGSGTPRIRARASSTLMRFLGDASAEVRFWCIYAIGQAKFKEARPTLEAMARTDDAYVPYLWRVSEEASDVLAYFDSGIWPDRVGGAETQPEKGDTKRATAEGRW